WHVAQYCATSLFWASIGSTLAVLAGCATAGRGGGATAGLVLVVCPATSTVPHSAMAVPAYTTFLIRVSQPDLSAVLMVVLESIGRCRARRGTLFSQVVTKCHIGRPVGAPRQGSAPGGDPIAIGSRSDLDRIPYPCRHAAVRLRVQKLPSRVRGAGAPAGRRPARMSHLGRTRPRAAAFDVCGGYGGTASGSGQGLAAPSDCQAQGLVPRGRREQKQARQGVNLAFQISDFRFQNC